MEVKIINFLPSKGLPYNIYYLKPEGKYYGWDAINNKFYNVSTPNFSDVEGLSLNDLQDGQVLTYNAETGLWENKEGAPTIQELSQIEDVEIPTYVNLGVLYRDTGDSLWKIATIPNLLGYTPQPEITLTTTGTNENSSLIGQVLNIPNYSLFSWNLLGNSGTNPTINFIGTTDNQPLVFRTNNVERFRILENGNFGIGTTSPAAKLDVNGGTLNVTGSGTAINEFRSNGIVGIDMTPNLTDDYRFRILVAVSGDVTQTAINNISINAGGFFGFGAGGSEKMRLTSSGNILIGTTTDAGFRLDVNGSVRVGGGAGTAGQLQIVSGTGQYYPSLTWINNGGSVQGQILGYGGILYTQNTSNFQFMNINAVKVGGAYGGIITSSILQVDSTTKGFLPPRMTSAQRTAIASPAVGLVVYQTDATEGLYINTSTGWKLLLV